MKEWTAIRIERNMNRTSNTQEPQSNKNEMSKVDIYIILTIKNRKKRKGRQNI